MDAIFADARSYFFLGLEAIAVLLVVVWVARDALGDFGRSIVGLAFIGLAGFALELTKPRPDAGGPLATPFEGLPFAGLLATVANLVLFAVALSGVRLARRGIGACLAR